MRQTCHFTLLTKVPVYKKTTVNVQFISNVLKKKKKLAHAYFGRRNLSFGGKIRHIWTYRMNKENDACEV